MSQAKKTTTSSAMERHAHKAEAMLKLLANAKRLLVLCQLVEGEKSAGELADFAGLSYSALSQHLAKMKADGLVFSEKRGQMVYYKIASMEVQALLSTLHLIYCR